MQEHVAGDLVDGVVAADVLHVDQRPVLVAEDAAVDRAGFQIEARAGVDRAGERVEPTGLQHRVRRQVDFVELLHQVAEHRALGAARGMGLLFQLLLVVGLARGADDDDLQLVVIVDAFDLVVGLQHVLVEEVADGQIVRIVADGHHRDDLLPVQEQGQRPLDDDGGVDGVAVLVAAGDALGEARVGGIGLDQIAGHGGTMGLGRARGKRWAGAPPPCCRHGFGLANAAIPDAYGGAAACCRVSPRV